MKNCVDTSFLAGDPWQQLMGFSGSTFVMCWSRANSSEGLEEAASPSFRHFLPSRGDNSSMFERIPRLQQRLDREHPVPDYAHYEHGYQLG